MTQEGSIAIIASALNSTVDTLQSRVVLLLLCILDKRRGIAVSWARFFEFGARFFRFWEPRNHRPIHTSIIELYTNTNNSCLDEDCTRLARCANAERTHFVQGLWPSILKARCHYIYIYTSSTWPHISTAIITCFTSYRAFRRFFAQSRPFASTHVAQGSFLGRPEYTYVGGRRWRCIFQYGAPISSLRVVLFFYFFYF